MHIKKINIENLAHCHYENLIEQKKNWKLKNILIDKKRYKDLVTYFIINPLDNLMLI